MGGGYSLNAAVVEMAGFWYPSFRKDADNLERAQKRATRMTGRLESLSGKERLKYRLFIWRKVDEAQ